MFFQQFFQESSAPEVIDGEVNLYADLPAAALHNGEIWLVKTPTGSPGDPGYKPAGFYVSNGTTWNFVGVTGSVESIQGTANQVLANGTSGSPQTGNIILTTPQDIGAGSSPTFAGLTLGALSGVLKATAGVISGSATTSDLTEGSNLYFTQPRVLATPLTGYSVGANTALAAADSILSAFGKVQGQINARLNLTLAGENYLSLDAANQVLTANAVNLAGTNVTGTLTIAKGGNNISSQTTNGVLFNNGTANTTNANFTWDNTNALLNIKQSTAGDATFRWNVASGGIAGAGLDDSDSDRFKLGYSNDIGVSPVLTFGTTGSEAGFIGFNTTTLSATFNANLASSSAIGSFWLGDVAGANAAFNVGMYFGAQMAPTSTTTTLSASAYILPNVSIASGKTITSQRALYIDAGTKTGTGTITAAYGLYVENPTYGTTNTCAYFGGTVQFASTINTNLTASRIVGTDGSSNLTPIAIGSGLSLSTGTLSSTGLGGTVTSVSVVPANGVSGSVATATTTPAITLTLGAITPSSVAASGTVTGSNLSGTNTGNVTLAGENYLSIASQIITANAVNLGSTNVTGTLTVGKGGSGTSTTFTQGSVVFAGASGVYSQDNANLNYNSSTGKLSVHSTTFGSFTSAYLQVGIDVSGTYGAFNQSPALAAFISKTNNGGTTPAALEPVMTWVRAGIGGQAYNNVVEWNIGRSAGSDVNTQLSLGLWGGNGGTSTTSELMSWGITSSVFTIGIKGGTVITSATAPSGGSGDMTNITNPQFKIVASSGYVRIPYLSADASIATIYNYQTTKSVYWGETSDTGTYYFRGRTVNIGSLGTTPSLVAIDSSSNLNTSTTALTPTFAGQILSSGSAGTIQTLLTLKSPRSYAAAANDGILLVATASNGTLGTHDYGAILVGNNPATNNGGAGLFELRVGGSASNSSSNGLFLKALSTSAGTVSAVNLYAGSSVAIGINSSGVINIPQLGTTPSLVTVDSSSNLVVTNTLSSTVLGNVTKVTTTTLSSGSGTYNTPANCTHIRIRMWGGGGGGGGVAASTSSAAAAGGGGGGAYVEKIYINPSASYSYSIGAGGAGGTAGANTGSTGGNTTFDSSALIAGGGTGGVGSTAGTSVALVGGGTGGTAVGGDLADNGSNGMPGVVYSGTVSASGMGGNSPQGGGLSASRFGASNIAGSAGKSPGGGGSGAASNSNTNLAGGAGADGLIIIEEYYVG